jgi:two-component system chemotaxis sensor kinase CheA
VRDISHRQGKLIDLKTEGGETEVDKKVADLISEPLIHMIRNSCDHALETPEERVAAGKQERGVLTLRACREGRNLVVKIIDDGRGIDRRKVHEKAVRLGIPVGSPEDDNLLDVIFLPGFSMKDEVSDISGRGVGMDVVKSTLAALGGTVHIASAPGEGTTITMDIPMSMGVSVAMQVIAGGQQYAIPIENVLETVKVAPRDIHDLGATWGIHYRGEILPVARLERFLGREKVRSDVDRGSIGDEDLPVVVITSTKGKQGLIIDRLLRNCEIAIKPVPDSLASLAFLGGVTILGDGRVVLVLNPEHLI